MGCVSKTKKFKTWLKEAQDKKKIKISHTQMLQEIRLHHESAGFRIVKLRAEARMIESLRMAFFLVFVILIVVIPISVLCFNKIHFNMTCSHITSFIIKIYIFRMMVKSNLKILNPKIVIFLGAGFSNVLNYPIMSEFVKKHLVANLDFETRHIISAIKIVKETDDLEVILGELDKINDTKYCFNMEQYVLQSIQEVKSKQGGSEYKGGDIKSIILNNRKYLREKFLYFSIFDNSYICKFTPRRKLPKTNNIVCCIKNFIISIKSVTSYSAVNSI